MRLIEKIDSTRYAVETSIELSKKEGTWEYLSKASETLRKYDEFAKKKF